MHFKNLLALIALMVTAYFSLATSKKKDPVSPTTGTYYILSDCVIPAYEVVATLSNNAIVSPFGLSFTTLGFPQNTIGQTVIGFVGGVQRECTVTYGEDGTNNVDDRWLYSCFDAGKYKCSIYVQPQ